MRSMTPSRLVACLSCIAFASAAFAQAPAPDDDWKQLNHDAREQAKAGDYAALRQTLVELKRSLPGSPTLAYNLAASAARLGQLEGTLSPLWELRDSGLVYDLDADADFATMLSDPNVRAVRDQLKANKKPVGQPTRLMTFAATDALPESLAWDERTKRLFVSDVRHCEIRLYSDPTQAPVTDRRFAQLPASVFALGIDAKRQRLWATVATVAQADGCGEGPAAQERTALLALDLRTGRVVQRVEAGLPGVLGDMLVADDGTVFVTESVHGAVLRLRRGAKAFDRIDVAGEFASPQTPVLTPDGSALIVPDYVRGIAFIRLRTCPCGAWFPINGAGVFTAGIDGLALDGGSLLAVQNGTSPPRVVKLAIDLSRQRVLESNTPGLGEPTHAIVVGRSLWFIADVGWDRLEASGQRKADAPPSHAELRSIALTPDRP
jgi:hypothetical protein